MFLWVKLERLVPRRPLLLLLSTLCEFYQATQNFQKQKRTSSGWRPKRRNLTHFSCVILARLVRPHMKKIKTFAFLCQVSDKPSNPTDGFTPRALRIETARNKTGLLSNHWMFINVNKRICWSEGRTVWIWSVRLVHCLFYVRSKWSLPYSLLIATKKLIPPYATICADWYVLAEQVGYSPLSELVEKFS